MNVLSEATDDSSHSDTMNRKPRFLRWTLRVLVVLALLIIGGEVLARYGLGLGTPPLTITHPTIEYLFAPNQDVYRFGNHQKYNQYSMRSDDFPRTKSENELRVLVFGDSIINGGNQTDQSKLATTLLKQKLESKHPEKTIVVGNISAGSWGPGNQLAYAKEFGFFDADIVVLVISSHDANDTPSFGPLDPSTHPTQQPWSALWEGCARYLPRYIPALRSSSPQRKGERRNSEGASKKDATEALRNLIVLAGESGAEVVAIQYLERSEIQSNQPERGFDRIAKTISEVGIASTSTSTVFNQSIENGNDPFRDYIHPNDLGQELLGDILFETICLHLDSGG